MKDPLVHSAAGRNRVGTAGSEPPPGAPLLDVLWRRRWTVLLTMAFCVAGAAVYLVFAPRVFRAAARVVVGGSVPAALGESRAESAPSEHYVENQRDVVQSYAVLSRALQSADYKSLKTFADVTEDPATWLKGASGFDVDVANKSDVIVVSMESRYPEEAAEIVNAVVKAYLAEQLERKRSGGEELVRVLRKQKEEVQGKWDAALQSMLKEQRASGVLSFRSNDNGNIVGERAAALSAALTSAQIAAVELRAQRDAVAAALANSASASAYVESLQLKGRDTGDREYDELRAQVVQQGMALRSNAAVLLPSHPGMQLQQARLSLLKMRVAEKEREIIEGQIVSISTQLAAAEQREKQLREALTAQQAQAMDMSPGAVRYATLEAEALRLQRQSELLDSRIAGVTADRIDSRQSNAEVTEWARPGKSPVKPRTGLTLLAAAVAGWVLAVGLAMLRESRDSRLHTPDEALALLGTPVLAAIPRMNLHLSPVARGQMVHLDAFSPAAEAYRTIRMSLSVGAAREAKTILVTSPGPADGKSTTASNLAIAFAQAGHRTLLLDCDLRQPVQQYVFEPDAESDAALTGVLAGRLKLRGAVLPTQIPGLYLLPCGPVPANPSELLAGKRFEQVLETLAESFDRIIIDSPSLMSVSDARSLAMLADATVLVLRMNQSPRELCAKALDALEGIGVEVAGIVANDVLLPRRESSHPTFEGSWPYATTGGSVVLRGGELEAAGVRTTGAARPLPRPPEEVLAIEDPDWAATAAAEVE